MDYILRKLDRMVQVSEQGTLAKQTYLRERIEYSLFLIMGYLWNKNIYEVNQETRERITADLHKISIGQVVGAIRALDLSKEISKKAKRILDDYPNLRNRQIGHGYAHSDVVQQYEQDLDSLYKDLLVNFEILSLSTDIIIVDGSTDTTFKGIRLSSQDNGLPSKWSCPKEVLSSNEGNVIDRVFIYYKNKYYKISPFIYINEAGEGVFIFNSLFEKLSGGVKYCRAFRTEEYEKYFQELIVISEDTENRRISSNGTIMNHFELNYDKYIDIPEKRTIENFITQSDSYVSATVWGHGGVGKTACIQSICMDFFNRPQRYFSYIVFMSAKNRKYEAKSGEILQLHNIRTYMEIVKEIVNVVFDEQIDDKGISELLHQYEEKIYNFNTGKMLIVIDDYETFEDQEKEKISKFIRNLKIMHHKVIITTRNKRLAIGENISTTEFDKEGTVSFLKQVIQNQYPEHYPILVESMTNNDWLRKIQDATSGRPIFIYQFAHLFAQHGNSESILEHLSGSENAQSFLYGRLYDHLSVKAQDAFVCISQITNENDMIFRGNVLEFLLIKEDSSDEAISQAIEELTDQKVIEIYDSMYYRVYSKELFKIMKTNYNNRSAAFRDTIKNKLDGIGGSDIKGSIYDAMLNEANKTRNIGNEKETTEKYKRLLNERKCPVSTKRTALINLVSYLSNDRLNLEMAISVMNDYYHLFKVDVNINKIYAQLLWSGDEEHKLKAVQLLKQFFYNKENRKSDRKNMELFSLAVSYFCNVDIMFMRNNEQLRGTQQDEKFSMISVNKNLNEYGRELFELVRNNSLNQYQPAVKHNIVVALMQTINLCIEIGKADKSKLDYCREIISYAHKNFPPFMKTNVNKAIDRLSKLTSKSRTLPTQTFVSKEKWWEDFSSTCKIGDIVLCTVIGIKPYGAFVTFGDSYYGLVHISQIASRFVNRVTDVLETGEEVNAKIIDIDNLNLNVSLSIKEASQDVVSVS